ncbi:MAG: YggS family pyridoxal phosphate-dependent enzyme [Planctomycetaceae bacterium]|nr:YggS family pyridoxal phosphate-dependent enzyme [Planctomycetaceae bacterium]
MPISHTISENLARVKQRISSACERCDRDPAEIQLVAVTKYADLDWVKALIDLGQLHLGESRPQQLAERCEQLPKSVIWHMIGHLQRNKVRPVLETEAIIHSVDSLKLMKRIDRLAGELDILARVFIEVNISREEAKHGFTPENLSKLLPTLETSPHVKVLGLMGMAPYAEDPEMARPYFRELREIQQRLNSSHADQKPFTSLSIGMSGDFEVGIEEGATHIRVGSALFEGLA